MALLVVTETDIGTTFRSASKGLAATERFPTCVTHEQRRREHTMLSTVDLVVLPVQLHHQPASRGITCVRHEGS